MEDKNFIVRLKAQIDKKLTESGILEKALKGCKNHQEYKEIYNKFFDSLSGINLPS